MPALRRVAVLFGGRSAEHEISVISARFVVESLDPARFEAVLVGIDKDGRWHLAERAALLGAARDPRLVRLHGAAPPAHPVALAPYPDARGLVLGGDEGFRPIDVVFPVLHGPLGEDGTVQGLLELAGVPYVGAGVLGSAVGMDKDVMKRLLAAAGLPVVPFRTVRAHEVARDPAEVARLAGEVGYPMFVKPANLGSSVGISRVSHPDELGAALELALSFDAKVIVEGAVDARELECAVLGNDDPVASVPGEIVVDHPDGYYSYAAKYVDETGARVAIPAPLEAAEVRAVQELAVRVFRTLECAGMARVDLFLERGTGRLLVNEINTIPGFTSISMFPKLWEASGVSHRELVTRLVELALERGARRASLRTSRE